MIVGVPVLPLAGEDAPILEPPLRNRFALEAPPGFGRRARGGRSARGGGRSQIRGPRGLSNRLPHPEFQPEPGSRGQGRGRFRNATHRSAFR